MSAASFASRSFVLAGLLLATTSACKFAPPQATDAPDGGALDATIPDATPPPADASDASDAAPPDGGGDAEVLDTGLDDSGVVVPDGGFVPIPHLPANEQILGTRSLSLSDAVIDTGAMTITPTVGASLMRVPASGDEPELAVLRVGSFKVEEGARVRVVGGRPLIVVSSGNIEIDGLLEARANGAVPGPGAVLTSSVVGENPGQGEVGREAGLEGRSGGGGGGHGTFGAPGGDAELGAARGGAGGQAVADETIPILVGGSPGGSGAQGPCALTQGGGGGGALELYAIGRVRVSGRINVGGGGGRGGRACNLTGGAGAGGGSGGSLLVFAREIHISGEISANGGGGGGGASRGTGVGTMESGNPGGDGLGIGPAGGGPARALFGSAGGAGAWKGSAAQPGASFDAAGAAGGHAGGGGGGVGRIRLSHGGELEIVGQLSPDPVVALH